MQRAIRWCFFFAVLKLELDLQLKFLVSQVSHCHTEWRYVEEKMLSLRRPNLWTQLGCDQNLKACF